MPGIVGYGIYLPYYRIKLLDIAEAWNRQGLPGEKTVPAPDETPLTMARTAVVNALNHASIPSSGEIGAIYYCSNSSATEGSYAQDIAIAVSLNSDVSIVDLHGSPRSFTTAIQLCLDALNSKRIKYGIIVGSDILVGGLGTSVGDAASEYVSAAGAGAIILGNDGVIAELETNASHMTGIKERWRSLDEKHPRVGDGRFIRDVGYITQVIRSGKMLMEELSRSISEYSHIVLQQPHAQWVRRALGKLGVSREALKSKLTAPGMIINKFGDLGAACLPVALAEVFDKAQPDEKILTISYGAGGSDALSWIVKSTINEKKTRVTPVEKFLKHKEYVNYTTHLKYNKVISQFI